MIAEDGARLSKRPCSRKTGTDPSALVPRSACVSPCFPVWAAICVGLCAVSAFAYQEAPMLQALVENGELPPVEERLPKNPVVVEPVNELGVYGGTWRRLTLGARDIQLDTRMGYEPIVRWDRSGKKVAPGLAERWEVLDEGRTYIFHLREGLKWSDGHPLTSEDFVFICRDVYFNKELYPIPPDYLMAGGKPPEVTAPDPYTVVYHFAAPYGTFLEMMAYRGNHVLAPKHYLKQFHATYTPMEELERRVEALELDMWRQLYGRMANENENPDLPSWKPFKIVIPPPASRMIAERNPYYWKVDPAGNQLPYIDRIAYTDVQNNEIVTIKALAGEVDFQARRIDASNYPLFMENREKGQYRVLADYFPDSIVLYVNQYSKDPELRPILQDRRFRIALSVAINREELIFLIYANMAVPSRGVASPFDPYYRAEYDQKYLEYDPERANALLDEVGLVRGRDGIRRLPSGHAFRQVLGVYPSETGTNMDLWQLVADYFREAGLDFVVKMDSVTLSVMQICNGNSDFWAYQIPGLHWIVDPRWYVPWNSASYYAPLYGRYVASGGKDRLGVKPPPEHQRIVEGYRAICSTIDETQKRQLAQGILGQWAEECYTIGLCRTMLLTIVSNRFKNVPENIIHSWQIKTPGYIGIEQFYIDDKEDLSE